MKKNNDYNYFILSNEVYDDVYFKSSYKTIESKKDNTQWRNIDKTSQNNGLQTFVVIPSKKGKDGKIYYDNDNIVIAFRGTEFGKFDGDVTADYNQIVAGINVNYKGTYEKPEVLTQFKLALEFVEKVQTKYKPKTIATTGHSLGAGLAQYTAAELNLSATTFAGPNVYAILSPEAKDRVDKGMTQQYIRDYTHKDDPVGNFKNGDPWVSKKFYVKENDSVKSLVNFVLPGHPLSTYQAMFNSNGNIEFLLQPEETKKIIKEFQNSMELISTIRKNLMDYLNDEEKRTRTIYNNMMQNVAGSGKYPLVSTSAVTNFFDEKAQSKVNSEYFFVLFDRIMQLDLDFYNYRLKLDEFVEALTNATQTMEKLDQSLSESYGGK